MFDDFMFSYIDKINENLGPSIESVIEESDNDIVFECEDLVSQIKELEMELLTEASEGKDEDDKKGKLSKLKEKATKGMDTLKAILKELLKRISKFFTDAKIYIKKKIEAAVHGTTIDSKTVNRDNSSFMVLKDFDYMDGIKELYSSLVPLIGGFKDFSDNVTGIDVDKVEDLIGRSPMFAGSSNKGPSLNKFMEHFEPILNMQTAQVCSNGHYTDEELNKIPYNVKEAFFGKSEEKVGIQDYRFKKPIDSAKQESDKFIDNMNKLQRQSESMVQDILKKGDEISKQIAISANATGMFDPNKSALLARVYELYKKAVGKASTSLNIELKLINKLISIFGSATNEQLKINRALKSGDNKDKYESPKSDKERSEEKTGVKLDRKSLPEGKQESCNPDEEIDYFFEAVGEKYEVLTEATANDRMTMLFKKFQILCQKILSYVNRAVVDMVRVVEKMLVEYVNLTSGFAIKSLTHGGTVERAVMIKIPTMRLTNAMNLVNDVLETVVKNVEDFASVDIHNENTLKSMNDVTPLSMVLHNTKFNTIVDMIEDCSKKIKWTEVEGPTEADYKKLSYIDKSELTGSIKIIRSIESSLKSRINKVLKLINGYTRDKNISDASYNYCTKIVYACSTAFSVIQKGINLMNGQFLLANVSYQTLARLTKKDKADKKDIEKEESKTESVTESIDYNTWLRDILKRI